MIHLGFIFILSHEGQILHDSRQLQMWWRKWQLWSGHSIGRNVKHLDIFSMEKLRLDDNFTSENNLLGRDLEDDFNRESHKL
jgi:hypothetical protein